MQYRERLQELLATDDEPERFVRRGLQSLEAAFRELSVLALADWERTGVVAVEVFESLAALQRPSWGTWNGWLEAARRARASVLRQCSADQRERIEQATVLRRILELLDQRCEPKLHDRLQPLGDLMRASWGGRLKLSAVLTLPINLRNRVVHDAPVDLAAWQTLAAAFRPLLEYHVERDPLGELSTAEHPAPWFLTEADELWAFNGIERDFSVQYASRSGRTRTEAPTAGEGGSAVVSAWQRMMGRQEVQAADFRRLLSKLAPEEIKGVLLGDLLVGREVGAGGFAKVHLGRQLSTGRKVAVKILRDGMPEDVEQRFRQEARFLSQFDHPHIVSAYGFGRDPWTAPRLFSLSDEAWFRDFSESAPIKTWIALEWLNGQTLEEVFQAQAAAATGRVDVATLARWFSQAAAALSAVHAVGLIHRDVKPGNLMVTEDGALKVMDFGIARSQQESRTVQTMTGHAVGTPAYMSPEQLRAVDAESEVGPSTDLYSLCATFYELFTRRRLFDHDTESGETVRTRKLHGERPLRPRLPFAVLPWELETILWGGLEPESSDRYRSMDDLRRDIEHFLHDEPIEYRRPSWRRRMQLGYRRNRTVVNLVGCFLIAAMIGISFYLRSEVDRRMLAEANAKQATVLAKASSDLADQERDARQMIETEQRHTSSALAREKSERERSQLLLDRQYIANAGRAVDADDLTAALPWCVAALRLPRENPAREDVHRVRIAALLRQTPSLVQAWFDVTPSIVQFHPDGRHVLFAWGQHSGANGVVVGDLVTGDSTPVIRHPGRTLTHAGLSPDGRFIVTALDGGYSDEAPLGEARVWDSLTGKAVTTELKHSRESLPKEDVGSRGTGISFAAFSPDGRLLTTTGRDHTARVWEIAKGQLACPILWHEDSVGYAAFSPDGRLVATACNDGTARLWNVKTGEPATPPLRHAGQTPLDPFKQVLRLAFTNDGGRLITTTDGGHIRFWNTTTGAPIGEEMVHDNGLYTLRTSPDGRRFFTAAYWGSARVWDARTGRAVSPLAEDPQQILEARLSADGLFFVTGGYDRKLRFRQAETGRRVLSDVRCATGIHGFDLSPNTRLAAVGGGPATVWDTAIQTAEVQVIPHLRTVRVAKFLGDGDRLYTISDLPHPTFGQAQQQLRVFDATTLTPVGPPLNFDRRDYEDDVFCSVTPAGDRALGRRDGELRLWRISDGQALTEPLHVAESNLNDAEAEGFPVGRFSGDGLRVVVVTGQGRKSATGVGRVLDAMSGEPVTGPMQLPVPALYGEFSFDGGWVALAGHTDFVVGQKATGAVQVWDVATSHPVSPILKFDGNVDAVSFSRDRRLCLVRCPELGAQIFDTSDWRPLTAPLRTVIGRDVIATEFHPAGDLVLTACGDTSKPFQFPSKEGAARLWDARTGAPASQELIHRHSLRNAAFSRDGRFFATACWDGTARVWDGRTGEPVTPALPHDGVVYSVDFSPDNRRLLTTSTDRRARIWDLSPTSQPLADLEATARLLARFGIDGSGSESAVEDAEWKKIFDDLWDRDAGPFAAKPVSNAIWHDRQAERCERRGLSYGALLHLDRTLSERPKDPDLLARRSAALADLGRVEEALHAGTTALEHGLTDGRRLSEIALLQAWHGDWASYRRTCLRLAEGFGKATSPDDAVYALDAWMLDPPSAMPPESGKLLMHWAEFVSRYPTELESAHGSTPGRAWYRFGLPAEERKHVEIVEKPWLDSVVSELEEFRAEVDGPAARDWLFLAMTHARLGNLEKARESWKRVQDWLTQAEVAPDREPWTFRIQRDLLLPELHAELDDWKAVEQSLSKLLERAPAGAHFRVRRALVRLFREDRPGFDGDLKTLLTQYKPASTDQADAELTAEVLRLSALPSELPATAALEPLISAAVQQVDRQPLEAARHVTLGALLFRAGQFAQAHKRLEHAVTLTAENPDPAAGLFLAMTLQRLKLDDAAAVQREKNRVAFAPERLRLHERCWERIASQLLVKQAAAPPSR